MSSSKLPEGLFLVIALLILACGIGFAGIKISEGLEQFRSYDRYVTVKGLATKDVSANLAVWPIAHTVTGGNLSDVQNILEERGGYILSFLKEHGIDSEQVSLQQVNVQDLVAQSYRQANVGTNRYILTQTYLVRTADIDAVSKAAEHIGKLIKRGVVLAQTNSSGPTYLFTKLNEIKPAMIAEATQNARGAAEQFANDSGQDVGDIRRAYQGIFQILPRDQTYTIPESAQKNKTVRVVSTVDFYLE